MFVFSHIYRPLSFAIKPPLRNLFFFSTSASASPTKSLLAQGHQLRMSSVEQFVEDKITKNKIVVFSKTYCPYCRKTKQYFATNYPNESVEVVELDERDDGSAIQDYLLKKTEGRSVPRTFISGVFVGGNDGLHAKPEKEVKDLLAQRL